MHGNTWRFIGAMLLVYAFQFVTFIPLIVFFAVIAGISSVIALLFGGLPQTIVIALAIVGGLLVVTAVMTIYFAVLALLAGTLSVFYRRIVLDREVAQPS